MRRKMANILEAHQALKDGKKVYWHDRRVELSDDESFCHHQSPLILHSCIMDDWEIEELGHVHQARKEITKEQ